MDVGTVAVLLGLFGAAIGGLFREVIKAKDGLLKECQAKVTVLEKEARDAVQAKNIELAERQRTLEADIRDKEAQIAALLERSR